MATCKSTSAPASAEAPAAKDKLADDPTVIEGQEEALRHLAGAAATAGLVLELLSSGNVTPGPGDMIALNWLDHTLGDAAEVALALHERRPPEWSVSAGPAAWRALSLVIAVRAKAGARDEDPPIAGG